MFKEWAKGTIIGLLSVGVITVTVVGLWLGGVIFSKPAGQAEAYRQKNSASNWTQAQATFEHDYAAVQKLDRQVGSAQGDLVQFKQDHADWKTAGEFSETGQRLTNLETDLKGARQQCQNAVADYNAAARTYTLRDFRASDLPQQIGADDDQTTDCK